MAEIKIRELSIGDWVRYDFPEIGKMNIQVNSIDEEDNHIGAGGVGASAWSDVSEFEPIPLTPEILEKNGWSRKNNYDWYLFHDKDIRINIWFDKDRWDIEVSPEDMRVTYADITGRGTLHTHQLQHALRLAGVRKEIEL